MIMTELMTFLKIASVSALLFGWYLLFLRNRRLHQYNRFYLLTAAVAAIAIPLMQFTIHYSGAEHANVVSRVVAMIDSPGDEAIVNTSVVRTMPWIDIAIITYLFIALALLSRMTIQVLNVYRLKHRGSRYQHGGVTIISTDNDAAPFSFMGNVFWKDTTDINSEAGQLILKHELTHINQRHTWDKLFMQAVCAVYWINPLFWLMKRELAMVHEFIADETTIEDNDTATLATMLLQSSFGCSPAITNSFYFSPIKRRITMLKKNTNTRFALLRKLSVVPIAAAATFLFSFTFTRTNATSARHRITVVLDAGHGGKDIGGTGKTGLAEKDLTLRIVNKLSQLAGEYDINVIKTREGDNYPTLEERAAISNSSKADAFISIHVNQESPENKMAGDYLVYVSKANARFNESSRLAASIAGSMSDYKPQVVNKGLLVLKSNTHPAVLIECGNMDKANQVSLLQDDKQLEQLCRKILAGVVSFKNDQDKTPGYPTR
jgi:N-acetylmuramoyl-L-alanine amidase